MAVPRVAGARDACGRAGVSYTAAAVRHRLCWRLSLRRGNRARVRSVCCFAVHGPHCSMAYRRRGGAWLVGGRPHALRALPWRQRHHRHPFSVLRPLVSVLALPRRMRNTRGGTLAGRTGRRGSRAVRRLWPSPEHCRIHGRAFFLPVLWCVVQCRLRQSLGPLFRAIRRCRRPTVRTAGHRQGQAAFQSDFREDSGAGSRRSSCGV